MDELFQIESVSGDSPRLLWMKKHHLDTIKPHTSQGHRIPWMAGAYGAWGFGATEEEACRDWGVRQNVRLWNEE